MTRHILPDGTALLLASCSSLPVPGRTTTGAPTETARQIMKQSAAGHGDAWRKYHKVKVEYIQRPSRAKAHQWRMESLKLDGSHAVNPANIR